MATDERVGEFQNRPLAGKGPCVWRDATYLKLRQGGLFDQPDRSHAGETWSKLAEQLRP